MIIATAIASVSLFLAALWAFGVVRADASALANVRGTAAALSDAGLDDEARNAPRFSSSGPSFRYRIEAR